MKNLFIPILTLALFVAPALAQNTRDIGSVDIAVDSRTIPIRVAGSTAELNSLALQAFSTHGRYRLVNADYTFDMQFTQTGTTQVRVAVTRSGSPVVSQTVDGRSLRQALLRAADIAVERTNGLGLKGYFSSRLVFMQKVGAGMEVCTSEDLFFGGVVRQTGDGKLALFPRWSPDGNTIIYTSYFRTGFPDIYTIDLVSRRRDVFVSLKGTNQAARFSPDGNRVAMILTGEGQPEVYVANAEPPLQIKRLTRSESVKSSPVFSPDGGRILFVSELPGGGGSPQLYIIPAVGGTAQRVSVGISNSITEPDWSRANPNKVVFSMIVGRPARYQIGVLDLSTRQGAQVPYTAPYDAVEPSWLPDGRHIVYTARTPTTSRICILDTVTGKSTAISPTSLGQLSQASVWAP